MKIVLPYAPDVDGERVREILAERLRGRYEVYATLGRQTALQRALRKPHVVVVVKRNALIGVRLRVHPDPARQRTVVKVWSDPPSDALFLLCALLIVPAVLLWPFVFLFGMGIQKEVRAALQPAATP